MHCKTSTPFSFWYISSIMCFQLIIQTPQIHTLFQYFKEVVKKDQKFSNN